MDTSTAKPEDVIRPEYLESYKRLHHNIFGRLVQVGTSITIIETISHYHYPLNKIYTNGTFWSMVYWNFMYSCIVLLHGLMNEKRFNDTLAMQKFIDLILNKWLIDDEGVKESFEKKIENAFSSESSEILKQIKKMRHNVVAHRHFDSKNEQLNEIPGVSFPQLKKAFVYANNLFSVCCFGVECITNLYFPTMSESEPKASDVVRILDLVVKNSEWLNFPERRGEFWEGMRPYKDKDDLRELNTWRKNYGLPPA